VLLGLVALGLGGCGGAAKSDGPPRLVYGEDICERCRMAINDERHAGAIVAGDATQRFDDVGELIVAAQEQGETERKIWVHDFESKEWLDGTTATYVWMPSRVTPMATGIVAFAEPARAEAFAAEQGGWTKSWAAMLAEWTWEG
jgi:copper chaperone NosL